MILSDRDIRAALESDHLKIEDYDDLDVQIQPSSFDVRLGPIVMREGEFGMNKEAKRNGPIYLAPQEFALMSTIEYVTIPDDMVAQVEGRSSWGRQGLLIHATAGYIDPGFSGNITLEMFNLSRRPLYLSVGCRIGQLVFHRMTSPAERPYGKDRGSKYHGRDSIGTVGAKRDG